MTRVLLAMAPKVRMHEPDMPGVLFVRIVEKLSLSTGASREAPVDKWAHRHTSIDPSIHPSIHTNMHTYIHALSTGASREAPVDKCARYVPGLLVVTISATHSLSTGASREAPVDT